MTSIGDRGILLYGGETAPPPDGGEGLSDTWIFSPATGWRPSLSPSPGVWGNNVAYDAQSDRVILLANLRGFTEAAPETWAYDPQADRWAQMSPAESPRFGEMAYDTESDLVIAYGGGATWAYDYEADAWTQMRPADSPTALNWHRLAYDAGADRVIAFGGEAAGGRQLAETWAYNLNADAWTELAPAVSPPARIYHELEYDPVSGTVLLVGGTSGFFMHEVPFGDLWAYDYEADTWSEIPTTGAPPARGWHATGVEAATGQLVLVGGGADRSHFQSDTWLFDLESKTWTQWQP